jgi:beta-lactam-binding protein with PASTA domain
VSGARRSLCSRTPVCGREPSQSIALGHATRTDPPARTRVDRDAAVTLLLSSGPASQAVEIPDVRGRPRVDALAALRDAGSAVTVVVSSGPPPLVVPELAGLRSAAAVTQLEEVGLASRRSIVGSSTIPSDIVIGTDPAAGTEVRRGTPSRSA